MTADAPTILATSGGFRYGHRTDVEFAALVHHAVDLSGIHGRRPRVTYVGTASGDPRFMNYRVTEAGRVAGFDVTCLDLFPMPNLDDVPGHLLIDDLRALRDAWAEGAPYRQTLLDDPREALTRVLLGMGSLSGAELSGERMGVAFDTREQEDEHSCFSDNTHRDIHTNALGIENVYLGRHGATTGASPSDLVAAIDPALDETLRAQLRASVEATAAIPPPFDQAIQAPDGSPARQAVADAIAALKAQTATIAEVAAALEITLNLEE